MLLHMSVCGLYLCFIYTRDIEVSAIFNAIKNVEFVRFLLVLLLLFVFPQKYTNTVSRFVLAYMSMHSYCNFIVHIVPFL